MFLLFKRKWLSPKIGLVLYFHQAEHIGFILSFMQIKTNHFFLVGPIKWTILQHPHFFLTPWLAWFSVKCCKLYVVQLLEAKEERISTFTLENDIDPANTGENYAVFHQL